MQAAAGTADALLCTVWSMLLKWPFLRCKPSRHTCLLYLAGSVPGYQPPAPKFVAADPDAITKFQHWPSIRYIHGIGGAVWTLAALVQFSRSIRKQHPWLHRSSGRVLLLGGVAALIGYWIMEQYHETFAKQHGIHIFTFYRPLGLWFAYTACCALDAALKRDWSSHAKWAIRHVGPGLTFSLARVLVLVVGFVLHYSRTLDMTVPANKMLGFYWCSYASMLICILGCERYVRAAVNAPSNVKL